MNFCIFSTKKTKKRTKMFELNAPFSMSRLSFVWHISITACFRSECYLLNNKKYLYILKNYFWREQTIVYTRWTMEWINYNIHHWKNRIDARIELLYCRFQFELMNNAFWDILSYNYIIRKTQINRNADCDSNDLTCSFVHWRNRN